MSFATVPARMLTPEELQQYETDGVLMVRRAISDVVEVLHGQQPVEELPHRAPLTLNASGQARRVDAMQRPPIRSPDVLRLGHVVLEVADFQLTCAWYTRHFGFIPSDVQVLPDGSPGVVFMRLDLGDTPADHHTLALAQGFMRIGTSNRFAHTR